MVSFGEEILASPPKRGISLLVWLAPPIALVLGGAAVALAIRGMRRGAGGLRRSAGAQSENKATGDLAPYLDIGTYDLRLLSSGRTIDVRKLDLS